MLPQPNIIDFLPPYLQQYRELRELTAAENPEFQTAVQQSEIIKDNQFIVSCDSDGIKRFEKILGIGSDENEPLEQRRFKVLLYWSSCSHYTLRDLIDKLNELGADIYKLYMDFGSYTLNIYLSSSAFVFYDILREFIKKFIPQNIVVVWRLWISTSSQIQLNHEISKEIEPYLSNPEITLLDGSYTLGGEYKLTNPLLMHTVDIDAEEV